jgi:predicted dienelactone hydrolase
MKTIVFGVLSATFLSAGTIACGEEASTDRSPDTNGGMADVSESDTSEPDADASLPDSQETADISAESDVDVPQTDAGGDVEVVPEPGAPGPYRVGHREETLTYDANDGSGPRSIRLVTWYPTEATTGDEVVYASLIPAAAEILGGAPPADIGPRPIVIFSHGNGSIAEQSYFFTEFLASHGYLVVACDHTGNSFGTGTAVEVFHRRPADISAIIDHLEALPASDPLAALVSDRIAISGHSFGGYTTLTAGGAMWDVDMLLLYCANSSLPLGGCDVLKTHEALYRAGFLDDRVDALIPMTPGAVLLFGGTGIANVGLPTLLMTGALDATTPDTTDGDPAWAQLSGNPENLRVSFATAGHFTFSNACTLSLGVTFSDGCGPGFLPPERAHRAINAYALAFLGKHLLAEAAGDDLLTGDRIIEPDITLSFGE